MKNIIIAIVTLLLSSANYCKAQYKGKTNLNLGINYILSSKNKSTDLNRLNIYTGIQFRTFDYFYTGAKINILKTKKDNNNLIDFGPTLGLDFWKFLNEQIITQKNLKYQNIDMYISSFFGFNLDKNTKDKKAFTFTNGEISAGISSKEILNNSLYLNYSGSFIMNRFEKNNFNKSIGLGTTISLDK